MRARTVVEAGYIDTRPWFCAGNMCTFIVDNLLVYRDDNHITDTPMPPG